MHDAAYRYVRGEVNTLKLPAGLVVEIGSRDINGSVRSLFTGRDYIGVDHFPGEGVDVVANGSDFVPPSEPAVVVSTETLEHTPHAEDICRNVAKMLAPGGVFIVTAAGQQRAPHSSVDGGALRPGEYYSNVVEPQLRQWLSDFSDIRIQLNPAAGDIYATAIKGKA